MTGADRPPAPTDHRRAPREPRPERDDAGRPREAPRGQAPAPDADAGHEPGYGHGV